MSQDAFDLDRIGGQRLLDRLVSEVLAAGADALALQRGIRVEKKPDRSPVTAADRAVEDRLRGFLTSHFDGSASDRPLIDFLGEESGGTGHDAAMRWILDPVDGTRAFIRGLDTWSVLLGLEVADAAGERVPVLGVAFLPAAESLFVGSLGGGARENGRPCRVSSVESFADALVAHGGLEQFRECGRVDLLESLAQSSYTQRGVGDFAGYALVLRGQADAMVDPGIKAWDIAPAAVLVREAGGRFSDFAGDATIHGGSGLATNGLLHGQALEIVAR